MTCVRGITIATGNDQHAQEIVESVKALPGVQWWIESTNPDNCRGQLTDVIDGADLFLGVSTGGVLSGEMVSRMALDPIVFAPANPSPEITPEEAAPYARVIATGRSDYPNQINNVLCFPGIFRGALDCRASEINEAMKLAAAHAIASCISDAELSADYIISSVFNRRVTVAVAAAVEDAAQQMWIMLFF